MPSIMLRGVEAKSIQMLEGVSRKTLAMGQTLLLVEFALRGGAVVPRHHHPNEQVGYVVKGKLRMTVGADSLAVEPGDAYHIPSNVEHQAEALEDSLVVDVFYPPREDYAKDLLAKPEKKP